MRPPAQLLFSPETASPSLVLGVALAPAVAAGLLLFRLAALEMLGIALGVGAAVHLGAHWLRQPLRTSPVLPAVVGVGLVGPAAPLPIVAGVAVVAAGLETLRARFLPGARLQIGLLAYSALFFATGGQVAAYLKPGARTTLEEPIRLWRDFYLAGQAPIDPVRLYVGNVAGPVFATSLLAVVVGAAWLWYARRLSLSVVAGTVVGALLPVLYLGWSPAYHLDSGPLWFVAALLLADRATLPRAGITHPLIGLLAGVLAVGARQRGFAIEAAPMVAAGLQVLTALVQGAGWLLRRELHRRQDVALGAAGSEADPEPTPAHGDGRQAK